MKVQQITRKIAFAPSGFPQAMSMPKPAATPAAMQKYISSFMLMQTAAGIVQSACTPPPSIGNQQSSSRIMLIAMRIRFLRRVRSSERVRLCRAGFFF